ncbi:MAG: galactokinase [Bacillota bacterium]|nr:galactokinase [Bacillota bacterium]
MSNLAELKEAFIKNYGDGEGIRFFASPGRVNLIGEHTDYNGGYVFPAAISACSTVAVRKRNDNIVRIKATDLDEIATIDINHIKDYKNLKYGNYQAGVIDEMLKDGYIMTGADMLYEDGVPHGGGLSSSAAIEVVTACVFNTFSKESGGKSGTPVDLALIGQKAENNYVGVNCGIMDQFASANGKKDMAMFLKCDDLSYELVPIKLGDCKLVLSNTNKKHKLGESKYNERRSECEKGFADLKKVMPDKNCLGEITPDEFEKNKAAIKDPVVLKRITHVIYEDDRVLKSVKALKSGDIASFGQYMNQSHASLKDLYEVTGYELDTLAETAQKVSGVIGSRMTGGGFGGCTVSIVKEDSIDNFIKVVGEIYKKEIGYDASFYIFDIGDGGREIK